MRLNLSASELLKNIDQLDWTFDLYISPIDCAAENSAFLVIDDDAEDERDDDGEPIYPRDAGYVPFLSVAAAQDVKENLKKQQSDFNLADFLNAINYYFKNDAFISVDS
ncbi:hypothetical protein N9H48_07115 [Pseudoalteromonas marina]|nr:hypothetical protein [Pseudoalteromonas marina]